MGVTVKGYKRVLGFTEATTEHSTPIKELFRDLLERGLRFAGGVLCIIDGSKGLRKAIADVFGRKALVQRCRWHKRENVVGYLPKADQSAWRAKLQRAYEKGSYAAARERLMGPRADFEQLNRRAARSLTEGLEETLTLPPPGALRRAGTEPEDDKLHREPKRPGGPPHRAREALASLSATTPLDRDPTGWHWLSWRRRAGCITSPALSTYQPCRRL